MESDEHTNDVAMTADVSEDIKSDKDNARDAYVVLDVVNPKPQIGLIGAITFGLGSMIGSGIFISPKGALQNAGSLGMAMIMWTLGGLISLVLGLVYCELGVRVSQSGGDFSYIFKGIGAVPAFLPIWVMPLFTNTASTAVLSLVFADYLIAMVFGSCTPPGQLRKIIGAVHIIALCISNIASVQLGVYIQIICSIAKVIALLVISIAGIVFVGQGQTGNFVDSFDGSATSVTSYCLALYSCMFAYNGFSRIGEIAEEIREPKKNIPRAIVISVLAVTAIYLMTNVSYFVLLTKPDFIASSAVAYDWALKAFPAVAILIPLSVLMSVYGANNGHAFTISRIMFAAARREMYPEIFSFLHVQKSLPVFSIIVFHVIALLMLIPGNIGQLINFLNFMNFAVMFMSCVSLSRMKWKEISAQKLQTKGFSAPLAVPIFGIMMTLFLIIAPFATTPKIEFVYAVAFVLGGYLLYVPFVHFKLRLPGIDRLTLFLQLVCNICPTDKID